MKRNFGENLIDNIETSANKMSKMKLFNFNLRTRTVILLFIILLIATASLSTYLVLNDEENLLNFSTTEIEQTTSEVVATTSNQDAIDIDILVVLTDNTPDVINMLLVLSINSETSTLTYKFIDASENVTIGSETISLQSYFNKYGLIQLVSGVQVATSDNIDRYISITQSSFSSLLAYFGNYEVEIEEDFTYNHNGINYVYLEGSQELSSDMLTKYVLCLNEQGSKSEDEIIEILSDYMVYFIEKYSIEEIYELMINLVTTNISAYDIVDNQTMLDNIFTFDEDTGLKIESAES